MVLESPAAFFPWFPGNILRRSRARQNLRELEQDNPAGRLASSGIMLVLERKFDGPRAGRRLANRQWKSVFAQLHKGPAVGPRRGEEFPRDAIAAALSAPDSLAVPNRPARLLEIDRRKGDRRSAPCHAQEQQQ